MVVRQGQTTKQCTKRRRGKLGLKTVYRRVPRGRQEPQHKSQMFENFNVDELLFVTGLYCATDSIVTF